LNAQDWEVFNSTNAGLPSNTVQAIAAGANGDIWVGTDWGLCQYSSGEWTIYQTTDSDLPSNDITALSMDADGSLWIGTGLDGIVVWTGTGSLQYTTDNSLLPDNTINSITHDHRGWVWIGTPLGLACITDSGWRIYNDTPDSHLGMQMFSPHINDVIVREDDLVAVSTMNGGLTYITETEMVYHASYNSNFPDNSQNAVVFDTDGDRWIASLTTGIIRHAGAYNEPTWFYYNAQNSGLPDNTITSMVIDDQDVKYAGTEIGGLIKFHPDGSWEAFDPQNSGLPDERILAMFLASDNSLWIGTYEGGVARYLPTVAVEDRAAGSEVEVFPSPFSDRLNIHWPYPSLPQWKVYDPTGRELASGLLRSKMDRIELSSMPGGLLYVVLIDGSTRIGRKVVKLQ
jgi:ligand-binding sensor domain-containing protein